ncbi:MAG: T9SS type A sorting domain-containing protein [Bacteroidota bacterium]|nr:T9SS type A sorting domain-containing protein [Bacteroidota bacterium]
MKQIVLTSLIVFFAFIGFSQITLQKTYNYSTTVVKLETLGYKYYLMDVPNSQVRIYNIDHSLFKTINCSVPTGYYLAEIKYVSENLFNSDSQIELAYTYYKYVATSTSYYYMYGAKVINESGNVLQPIDDAQYLYVNKTGDSEYKLFAYCFDYSVFPEKVWTNIYSLPGFPVISASISDKQQDILLKAWPNPASEIIRLEYELPSNVKSASLNVYDPSGRKVKNFAIDSHSDHIAMNVNDLSAGTYLYNIEYNNLRTSAKKIVIN